MTTEVEIGTNKLQELRSKHAATNAAIVQARNEIARCNREIGEIRIAAAIDSEANPPKTVETRCKKLESDLKASQTEIERLTPDAAVLSAAINRLEGEIVPKRHVERLQKQNALREQYKAAARKIVESANALAKAVAEATAIYSTAKQEFHKAEQLEGNPSVNQAAGLSPVYDGQWIDHGNGSRRDVFISAVYDFDPALVDPSDPVAVLKRHQEEHRRGDAERYERKRNVRLGLAQPEPSPKPENEYRTTVRHPLGHRLP